MASEEGKVADRDWSCSKMGQGPQPQVNCTTYLLALYIFSLLRHTLSCLKLASEGVQALSGCHVPAASRNHLWKPAEEAGEVVKDLCKEQESQRSCDAYSTSCSMGPYPSAALWHNPASPHESQQVSSSLRFWRMFSPLPSPTSQIYLDCICSAFTDYLFL